MSSPAVTNPTPVRLHILVQKKAEMTDDQFVDYWQNIHGKKFLEFDVVQKHVRKYEQFLDSKATRDVAEDCFGLEKSGWDGFAILTFDTLADVEAVYQDPEFVKWAVEDEVKFCAYPGVSKRFAVTGTPNIAFEKK